MSFEYHCVEGHGELVNKNGNSFCICKFGFAGKNCEFDERFLYGRVNETHKALRQVMAEPLQITTDVWILRLTILLLVCSVLMLILVPIIIKYYISKSKNRRYRSVRHVYSMPLETI